MAELKIKDLGRTEVHFSLVCHFSLLQIQSTPLNPGTDTKTIMDTTAKMHEYLPDVADVDFIYIDFGHGEEIEELISKFLIF